MIKKVLSLLTIFIFVLVLNGTINIETEKIKNGTDTPLIEKEINSNQQNLRQKRGGGEPQSAPDRILVKYKKQPDSSIQASVKATIESFVGIQEMRHFSFIDTYLYKTYRDKEKTLEELNNNPNIEYAEPDYFVYDASSIPGDPSFSEQWGLHNTGQTGGTVDADIDAPEAWDLTTGSSDVVVAVIDSGVDYNHEDLNANMWTNPGEIPNNGIDDDENGYVDDYYGINAEDDNGDPMDEKGHGTNCAGVIAMVGQNSVGGVGVCWTAKIMALNYRGTTSLGGSISTIIKCIEYTINKGAHILSCSWRSTKTQALKDAFEALKDAGILVVVAANNEGTNNDDKPPDSAPSTYDFDNIISVTTTDSLDNHYYSYGPYSVDVAAPGKAIYTTGLDNSYRNVSGTSFSTPFVAGLAALIKSYNQTLNWQQIKSRILSGVVQIASLDGKILTGGRINAYNSLIIGDINSYSLNIQSSPSTNALIGISPNDLNGQGDGYTNFTRTFSPYTSVTLNAPETNNGRKFGYWTLDGSRYSSERSIKIDVEYNHTIEAVYPIYTLTIKSEADTNIHIQVEPNDENGLSSGNTNFSREYSPGTLVKLTAPKEHNEENFSVWLKNGTVYDYNSATSIEINNNYTFTAQYDDNFKWRFFTGQRNLSSPAIASNGTVYFVADKLYAVFPDGTKKWEFKLDWWEGASRSTPAIGSDGTVYFCLQDKFHAVYPDGTKKWNFLLRRGSWQDASPAIGSDGTIYFGSETYFYALDTSGSLKWRFETTGEIRSSPAIGSDGTIYFGSEAYFYALNASGSLKWKFKTNEEYSSKERSPAIGSDGTIYFGVVNSYFYALDPSGNLKWKYEPLWDASSSPSIGTDGTIYFGGRSCDEMIAALDPVGNLKWRYTREDKLTGSVFSSPAVGSDGTIYFGSICDYVFALDSHGNTKWKFLAGGQFWDGSPSIGPDGTLYIGSYDGYFYALESDSGGLANSSWPKFRQNTKNTGRVPSAIDLSPTVTIISPTEGSTISDSINIQASAVDDNEVEKVEFYVNNELRSTDKISPYTYSWDTTTYPNTNNIKAIAYDNIGQTGAHEISVFRLIYPPLNLSGQKIMNRSLSQAEYINELTWQANPNNENINKYRIYQMEGNNRTLIVELNADTLRYMHRGIDKDASYTYSLVAVNDEGREGQPASVTVR